jgi:hypothetical protein
MTDLKTDDVLEREKLRCEVDKLQLEVTQMRRPLRQPTTLLAILVALLTSGVVGIQYQLNQIQAEQTKLEIAQLDGQRKSLQQEVKSLAEQRDQVATQLADSQASVSSSQQRIAEAQVKVTALEERLRSEPARPALYEQVRDTSAALRLAAATSEETATSLDLARREIKDSRGPRASGLLGSFKVGIYYPLSDAAAKTFAEQVEGSLAGNVSIVQLYPRDEQFFNNVNPPMGDEIRFEEPGELPAARELQTLLASRSPGQTFRFRAVGTRTPNFLSIFIDKR